MARKRNPRVVAVEILKELKRTADNVRARWTPGSTVYETVTQTRTVDYGRGAGPQEQTFTNGVSRPRRAEEYPENQSKEWAILWAHADDMEKAAAKLKAMALEQWRAMNPGYDLVRKES